MPSMRTIGHYRLLRQIGHGGMGVVYEAVDERLGRRVAVKLLADGRDDAARRRMTIPTMKHLAVLLADRLGGL